MDEYKIYDKLCVRVPCIFQTHASAWPFLKPVEKMEAPDYYDHIKYPMGKI